MSKSAFAVLAATWIASSVSAQGWFDPPGKSFDLYSQEFNDGYNDGYGGRGVLFTVTDPLRAGTYWWTNQVPEGTSLNWRLFEDGIVVDERNSQALGSGLMDHRVTTDYILTPGHQYDLNIRHQVDAGTANYFYAYDPAFFGDPPFNVGSIVVSDGEMGGDASNFVMPRMGIDAVVPTPASAALLGLAGLGAARRRR